MNSKETSKSKENHDEPSLNPQKKRLEQLKERKEQEAARQEELAQQRKNRLKTSREVTTKSPSGMVKMSAEVVDEYSVDEESEDEEIKNEKDEMLKMVLVENKKLAKTLKRATESEKKMEACPEAVAQWFDKYEAMVEELDQQLKTFEADRKERLENMQKMVKQLLARWLAVQKKMKPLKFAKVPISSEAFFHNLAQFGISFTRKVLFAFAYFRDMVTSSDSQRTVSSPAALSDKIE